MRVIQRRSGGGGTRKLKSVRTRPRAASVDVATTGFFRHVFERAPVAMLVRSVRGKLVDANRACELLLGYSGEDLRRSPFRALAHHDDLAPLVAGLQELIAGKRESLRMDVRFRHKNGGIVWARSAVVAARHPAGGVEHLVFFLDDITEQKRMEEALRESEALFRQLAAHLEDGVWMSTGDTSQILYVSPALERIYGVSAEELLHGDAARAQIHPDDFARVVAEFPTPIDAPFEQQYRVIARDGTVRWLRVRMFPIRDREGRVYRIGGITEDVTGRKHAANALEEARRHAARLVQAVREPLGVLYQALAPEAGGGVPDDSFAVRVANLTARERQVMDLLVAGHSTKMIANALRLSPKTVETYRGRVMHSLRVRSVAELVRLVLTGERGTP